MTRGVAIASVLLAGSLMSFIGLLLRMMEQADGFQISAYRSISLVLMVLVFVCIRRKVGPLAVLRSLDRIDFIVGLLLSVAFSFYVYALLNTSIASGLLILSSSPIFAAFMGWIWGGEKPSFITLIAIAMAMFGVTIMVLDGFQSGGLLGNLYALFSSLCFAGMLVIIRKNSGGEREDALGGTMLGGFFAIILNAIVAMTFGSGLEITPWDLSLSLFMGAFTIGLGIALITTAASYLPASEVSILVLIESVVGPFWVWLFLGETTSIYVVIGGAIVLGSVVLQATKGGAG